MTISNNSSARRAGFRANNESVKDSTTITVSKFGTRTLYLGINPDSCYLNGTSVAKSGDGLFTAITLPNANTGYLATVTRLPAEWLSGTDIKVNVYWKTSGTSGNVKFTIDLGAKENGETSALSNTQTVTTAADSTANKLIKSQVTFSNSLLTALDWLGIKILRDPSDASDTNAADVLVCAIVIEFTGTA